MMNHSTTTAHPERTISANASPNQSYSLFQMHTSECAKRLLVAFYTNFVLTFVQPIFSRPGQIALQKISISRFFVLPKPQPDVWFASCFCLRLDKRASSSLPSLSGELGVDIVATVSKIMKCWCGVVQCSAQIILSLRKLGTVFIKSSELAFRMFWLTGASDSRCWTIHTGGTGSSISRSIPLVSVTRK